MKRSRLFSKTHKYLVCVVALIACLGGAASGQMPALCPLPDACSSTGHGECKPAPPPPDPDHFVFFAAGDNRPAEYCDPQSYVPKTIFAAAQAKRPSLIVWTGDTIAGKIFSKSDDEQNRVLQEYNEFLVMAKTSGVPLFNAPGNHEMDSCANKPLPLMMDLYKQCMGAPFGAFNYGNSRFIALNTEELNPASCNTKAAAASSEKAVGYVGPEQLQILENDLTANQDKKHIFIFMHHPIKPAKKGDEVCNSAELEDLLKKYPNVSYVLAGHEHLYYFPGKGKKGPGYVVTGGAGARLKHLKIGGDFYHYLIFTVDGEDVTFKLKKVKSPKVNPPPKVKACAKQKCEF